MSDALPHLSKSKIMSSMQCIKRLFLEVNHPELITNSANTEASFEVGHEVGDIAVQLYGEGRGTYIKYEQGMPAAVAQTQALMQTGPDEPIFEATFEYAGVLVRVDVLLPDGDGWKIVEVKSSTKIKDEHYWDCAIQTWVFQQLGYSLTSIALAHINNQFVYNGQQDYRGLLQETDLSMEVAELVPQVPDLIAKAQDTLKAKEPEIGVGQHCTKPYDCPFLNHCWPSDTRYPIRGLGGSKKTLSKLVNDGICDITEIPTDTLTNAKHQRIHRITLTGEPELLPCAAEFVANLDYPRYYLDFETIGPAVPIWAGTRPYQALPIQWSCHIEQAPGEMRHAEFLDLSGEPPMRALAEAMIHTLGTEGPILMYTSYEQRVILGLADAHPDLADPLNALVGRLVDLAPVARDNYYHPDMMGSWSIKAVLPTIDAEMNYAKLEGINQGQAASAGFIEAIHVNTPPQRVEELKTELLKYCRFDTEAMVRLVEHFGQAS